MSGFSSTEQFESQSTIAIKMHDLEQSKGYLASREFPRYGRKV